MSIDYSRLVRVSLLYGMAAFLVFAGGSLLAWKVAPYATGTDTLARQMTWFWHVLGEKCGGMILICLLAFFAARACRSTWKLGVITAVSAAFVFQFVTIAVYVLRFGLHAYRTYNGFWDTILMTLSLSYLFGFLAVWEQYRQEKRPSATSVQPAPTRADVGGCG